LTRAMDPATVQRALNATLPDAVRVLGAAVVPPSFHPRYDARAKTYRYRIWNGEVLSPFERGRVWHVLTPALDVAAMAAAAARIEGRHDFAAFQASGSDTQTTDRQVFSSRVYDADRAFDADRVSGRHRSADLQVDQFITYEIAGDGFLRHMVRAIVGTLVEIGRGKRPVSWVDEVLASRDRAQAGRTAPAEGLFLVRVDYDAQL
jgi:tRNA pseudouridine38-40 synthase